MNNIEPAILEPRIGMLSQETEAVSVSLSPILESIKNREESNTNALQRIELKEIFKEVDCIRILAGGTEKHVDSSGNVSWRTPAYKGSDSNGLATGAVFRVAAASIVLSINPSLKVVVGSSYPNNTQPAPNEVMRKELELMNVRSDSIISDPETLDTISELVHLIELAEINQWKNVVCITNGYHCPRVKALIENLRWITFPKENTQSLLNGLKRMKEGRLNVQLISAEDLLQVSTPDIFKEYVEPELQNPKLVERIQKEQQGLVLLENGVYGRMDYSKGERVQLRKNIEPTISLL